MKEIQVRNDCAVTYREIQDGEAIEISLQTPTGITDRIILVRPVALKLAKVILKMMGENGEGKK